MYSEILGLDINKISKYTKEDIKEIYKKIALECHPDKLVKIENAEEKNRKIEKFKKACLAYKRALEDFDNYGRLRIYTGDDKNDFCHNFDNDNFFNSEDFGEFDNVDINFWEDMYSNYFNDKNAIKNTFINLANIFLTKGLTKGLKTKNYYNPSSKIIKHSIILPVNYLDLYTDKSKKIRILLKGVKKPFNFSILCKKEYPVFIRQYIDDDGIEHEIEIKMMISNIKNVEKTRVSYNSDSSNIDVSNNSSADSDNTDNSSEFCDDFDYDNYRLNNKNIEYNHKISNDRIDLLIDLFINLKDYLEGSCKTIKYIDNNYINIDIPSFTLNKYIINNKGLLGGNLIINIILLNISKINWDKLESGEKKVFIKSIENIYKN
jgi:DnaJ-class molecular chaperone